MLRGNKYRFKDFTFKVNHTDVIVLCIAGWITCMMPAVADGAGRAENFNYRIPQRGRPTMTTTTASAPT